MFSATCLTLVQGGPVESEFKTDPSSVLLLFSCAVKYLEVLSE